MSTFIWSNRCSIQIQQKFIFLDFWYKLNTYKYCKNIYRKILILNCRAVQLVREVPNFLLVVFLKTFIFTFKRRHKNLKLIIKICMLKTQNIETHFFMIFSWDSFFEAPKKVSCFWALPWTSVNKQREIVEQHTASSASSLVPQTMSKRTSSI